MYLGVNTSYANFGSIGSFFPFHVEDLNLGSINRIYSGEPKIWFCFISTKYYAVVKYLRFLIFFEINNLILNYNSFSLKYIEEFKVCEFIFRLKYIFFNPFTMISDPIFKQCVFVKPYFSIVAEREDEIIIVFEQGNKDNI